jgi:hypothetical protein
VNIKGTLCKLYLEWCAFDRRFIQAFTFDPAAPAPRPVLRLSRLTSLSVIDFSDEVDAASLVEMAESLSRHRGRSGNPFPALKVVCLSLTGRKFESNIEDRLAAACRTGFIIDDDVDKRTE